MYCWLLGMLHIVPSRSLTVSLIPYGIDTLTAIPCRFGRSSVEIAQILIFNPSSIRIVCRIRLRPSNIRVNGHGNRGTECNLTICDKISCNGSLDS